MPGIISDHGGYRNGEEGKSKKRVNATSQPQKGITMALRVF